MSEKNSPIKQNKRRNSLKTHQTNKLNELSELIESFQQTQNKNLEDSSEINSLDEFLQHEEMLKMVLRPQIDMRDREEDIQTNYINPIKRKKSLNASPNNYYIDRDIKSPYDLKDSQFNNNQEDENETSVISLERKISVWNSILNASSEENINENNECLENEVISDHTDINEINNINEMSIQDQRDEMIELLQKLETCILELTSDHQTQIKELQKIQLERDFYFQKLRSLEEWSKTNPSEESIAIREILFHKTKFLS